MQFKGFWAHYGPQAIYDFLMVRFMLKRIQAIVPMTYVPILRLLSEDPKKVNEGYRRVLARREPVRLFDSPRTRWRKRYGSHIRELEWVYDELHSILPKREFEDLVVGIMAEGISNWIGFLSPSLERGTRGGTDREGTKGPRPEPGRFARWSARQLERLVTGPVGAWMLRTINPSGFLVGPVEMRSFANGEMEMFVPECYMHTVVGTGKPQDHACVYGCKGACEQVFGPDSIMTLLFEPHLPELSCTMRAKIRGMPRA